MKHDPQPLHNQQVAATGRLLTQPTQPTQAAPRGRHRLELDTPRDGVLYVPMRYRADTPVPLVVLLHGAGGSAKRGQAALQVFANMSGIMLLVPESRGRTWDIILGNYGPDVAFIDQALAQTFSHYAVNPARLAIGGFSDGASYALSLGLTNGDLFTHILGFSPGLMAPAQPRGRPPVFIAHGTRDRVLSISQCSRRIVPHLQHAGYDVCYHEFNGPHIVPPHIVLAAVRWFTTTQAHAHHR